MGAVSVIIFDIKSFAVAAVIFGSYVCFYCIFMCSWVCVFRRVRLSVLLLVSYMFVFIVVSLLYGVCVF